MAKSYTLAKTKHPQMFRLMDRERNWRRYVLVERFEVGYDPEKGLPTFWDMEQYVILDGVTTILDGGYTKGKYFDKWNLEHTPEDRDKILAAAGERGDMTHRTIDLMLSGEVTKQGEEAQPFILTRDTLIYNKETSQEEPIENKVWDCLLAFGAFVNAHNAIVYASEMPLYNKMFGYAGTGDAILMLQKECDVDTCKCGPLINKLGLWDWKTSSGIRASYGGQTAAYALAENLHEYLPPAQNLAYTAILRLGTAHVKTGGYEMAAFFNVLEKEEDGPYQSKSLLGAWNRFLGAKRIFDYENKPFSVEKDVIEIPDEIQITVPRFDLETARAEAFVKMNASSPDGFFPAGPIDVSKMNVTEIDSSKIDLAKLKVGVWIRHSLGGVARVTKLTDDGMVSFVNGGFGGQHHISSIREIFDGVPNLTVDPADIETPKAEDVPKKKPLKKVDALKKKLKK